MNDKFKDKYRIESTRLQNWDYANSGAYYVTICTKNKELCFGKIHDGIMKLSSVGIIASVLWYEITNYTINVELGAFVVMPNHIHCVIYLLNNESTVNDESTVETRHALSKRYIRRDAMICILKQKIYDKQKFREENDMNAEERERKFREWALGTMKTEISVDSYIKVSLKDKIPKKMIELKEKQEDFKSVFQINSIDELKKIYDRMKSNGDLFEFSKNIYNQQPSAAIKKYYEFLESNNLTMSKKESESNSIIETKPLNQILYGPPGTGKTYHTIDKAVEIIDKEYYLENKKDRKKLKERFEELKNLGQIEFVTFHQSYGYEEFVEGIKALDPDHDLNTTDSLIYKTMSGVFKKLSDKALINFEKSQIKTKVEIEKETVFTLKLEKFKNLIEDEFENDGKYYINETAYIFQIDNDAFRYGADTWKYSFRMKFSDLFQFQKSNVKTRQDIKKMKNVSGLANQHATYFIKLFEKFNNVKIDKKNIDKSEIKKQNYILIIDEINRGNISKIFGELITLIEPSKRIGAEEEIRVSLPYSNDKFGVPENLYIIGTMNTADRSIAQIDTALRRRFEFEEMMPNLALMSNEKDKKVEYYNSYETQANDLMVDGINIRLLLKGINERIEYLYDREHTIGHSYFIDLIETPTKDNLNQIFRNRIIPLLAEYFYEDWEDIKTILNDVNNFEKCFIIRENDSKFAFNGREKTNKRFTVNKKFSLDAYKKIYELDEKNSETDNNQ